MPADKADPSYVQFVFNGSLVIGFLYIATQFILAVRRDVQERIEEVSVGAYAGPTLSNFPTPADSRNPAGDRRVLALIHDEPV